MELSIHLRIIIIIMIIITIIIDNNTIMITIIIIIIVIIIYVHYITLSRGRRAGRDRGARRPRAGAMRKHIICIYIYIYV